MREMLRSSALRVAELLKINAKEARRRAEWMALCCVRAHAALRIP